MDSVNPRRIPGCRRSHRVQLTSTTVLRLLCNNTKSSLLSVTGSERKDTRVTHTTEEQCSCSVKVKGPHETAGSPHVTHNSTGWADLVTHVSGHSAREATGVLTFVNQYFVPIWKQEFKKLIILNQCSSYWLFGNAKVDPDYLVTTVPQILVQSEQLSIKTTGSGTQRCWVIKYSLLTRAVWQTADQKVKHSMWWLLIQFSKIDTS